MQVPNAIRENHFNLIISWTEWCNTAHDTIGIGICTSHWDSNSTLMWLLVNWNDVKMRCWKQWVCEQINLFLHGRSTATVRKDLIVLSSFACSNKIEKCLQQKFSCSFEVHSGDIGWSIFRSSRDFRTHSITKPIFVCLMHRNSSQDLTECIC